MSEQSLSEKIAALPAEERAARYLQVVREQGLSMATQRRWLDEKDETIASLRQRVADLTRALEFYANSEWADGYPGGVYVDAEHTTLDFGDTARAALASSDSK